MKTFIYENKPTEYCYGCSACKEICHAKAITMVADKEGFLYPQINSAICTNCGLCEKICPTQEENIYKLFHSCPQHVNAAWNKNLADRLESTSGGIFFLLANQCINDGGVVYGVALDEELHAKHVRISSQQELYCLRGSKYVQSDTQETFQQIKQDLLSGTYVLYSGTPCQIAGLRLFLRKDYEELITIDLVCHGVPSPYIFKEHIHYIEKKEKDKITDFKFRAKKKSGWRSYAKYIFRKRQPIYNYWGADYFCHAFQQGYLNRKSCFTCNFSTSKRIGDITLSDFWNAEKYSKELKRQRKYGFNLVMCNSPKGQNLFKKIDSSIECRSFPIAIAIKGDVRLRQAEPCPAFREQVYEICRNKGYDYLVKNHKRHATFIEKIVPTWSKNIIKEIQSHF